MFCVSIRAAHNRCGMQLIHDGKVHNMRRLEVISCVRASPDKLENCPAWQLGGGKLGLRLPRSQIQRPLSHLRNGAILVPQVACCLVNASMLRSRLVK